MPVEMMLLAGGGCSREQVFKREVFVLRIALCRGSCSDTFRDNEEAWYNAEVRSPVATSGLNALFSNFMDGTEEHSLWLKKLKIVKTLKVIAWLGLEGTLKAV